MHCCKQPLVASTGPMQPDWECGRCGRVWRDMRAAGVQWWAEVRGPTPTRQMRFGPGGQFHDPSCT